MMVRIMSAGLRTGRLSAIALNGPTGSPRLATVLGPTANMWLHSTPWAGFDRTILRVRQCLSRAWMLLLRAFLGLRLLDARIAKQSGREGKCCSSEDPMIGWSNVFA